MDKTGPDQRATLLRGLLAFVTVAAMALVFVEAPWLVLAAAVALLVFLTLNWRQFTLATWVPVILSLGAFVLALVRDVPGAVLMQAAERMVFLAALIAVLGTLRSAAATAREVALAGAFLTGQPASRRYLALSTGGHFFGVLINFGGLALLLDLSQRSLSGEASAKLPPDIIEAKSKRMTLAIMRGFSLISMWSPLGFATNGLLIALPGITYFDFGPIGFAMSFVFLAVGWAFDRIEGRQYRGIALPKTEMPADAWKGAALLLGHVALLGVLVIALHETTVLSFQEALILLVPTYALLWAALSNRAEPTGMAGGVRTTTLATWQRLSGIAGEVGVFGSAGFLSVILLALIPLDTLRMGIADLGFGPISLVLGLALSIVGFALVGLNPIVTASVLGAIASQLAMPGLSDTAIALAMTGSWTVAIGVSPVITTVVLCASSIGKSPMQLGPIWNGPYSLTTLGIWCVFVCILVRTGAI